MAAEDRIAQLGITLPEVLKPVANYVMSKRSGSLLFLAGHVGRRDGEVVRGRFGGALSREEGNALARLTAIDILSSARASLGSLDRVTSVIKLTGFVTSDASFTDQPFVVNGASDLFVDVFGEDAGKHARSAVGVPALPLGAALEIEAILEVRERD